MNHRLYFNFYGIWASFSSPHKDLRQRIEWDFSYFYSPTLPKEVPDYQFYAEKCAPPWEQIPAVPVRFQSANSLTYQVGPRRFNDYYGKALTIYHYQMDSGFIYSKCLEKLHELTYLMILSRVGKKLDMQGLHKLHAFGIIENEQALLGIMPMKGGKSTHFLEFIKDPRVQILSDDTPLISRWGKILPFPIRVGIDDPKKALALSSDPSFVYQLDRQHYGKKTLLSLKGLPNPVGSHYQHSILLRSIRFNGPGCSLEKSSKLTLLRELVKFQVIGLGLPIILEYFWELGPRDFAKKSFIVLSRFCASVLLILRSKTYTVFLGTDPEKNVEVIRRELLNKIGRP